MSLPEPINWLHMSSAEYIYFVSTNPLTAGIDEGGDIFQNFSEPSDRAHTVEMKQRFWNLNDWEAFIHEEKAIERAKQKCIFSLRAGVCRCKCVLVVFTSHRTVHMKI